MTEKHSRRRRPDNKIPVIIAAFAVLIAAVLIAAVLIRGRSGHSVTHTSDAAGADIRQDETFSLELEETESEQKKLYFTDKKGKRHGFYQDEDAAVREYEQNIPRVDDYGNPVFEKTDEAFPDYEMIRGIDVSAAQGDIDWYSVRSARCDFVLICADEMFDSHYQGAYECGLKTGVYYCSDAACEEEARADARELLDILSGREIDLFAAYVPECMDKEDMLRITDSSDNKAENAGDAEPDTEIAEAFCEEIANGGYRPAIYSSMLSEAERYDMSGLAGKYDFWYSDFGGTPETPYPFSTWQYCLTGGIDGITGPVHLDVYLQRPYEETDTEQKVFTYTQFAHDAYETTTWVNKRAANERWTGEWAKITSGGQEFMMFGCGICCLSNLVSTLTDKTVPPDEMFYSTKENTSYHPESGKGAVSWGSLRDMCEYYGLSAELGRKPSDYETFAGEVAGADAVTVLVCGDNDRRLWWYTDGHYVSLWEYDPVSETVFVADPAMQFNRLRVRLTDIYNALKTGSEFQYALIKRNSQELTE